MQRHIDLSKIVPNKDQPRKEFDGKLLDELAASILENGLAQPITVRPLPYTTSDTQRWEIVMGERRYRAYLLLAQRGHAQFLSILCNVRAMDATSRDLNAIIENLQRVDVTPMEEARAFQRLLDLGMSLEELSKKIGRQQHRIEERTRLLKLEPSLLQLYERGQFSQEAAYHVSRLPEHVDQMQIFRLIQRGTVSGYHAIRASVDAVLNNVSQIDIFGDAAPKASEADVKIVGKMEERIETMARLAATGWKDGECVVATKVSPDRARLMADKMKGMQGMLYAMERELRRAAAQAEVAFAA